MVLLAATNASKIRKFNSTSGSEIKSFDVESSVLLMDTI
jgi:hypothetical protein